MTRWGENLRDGGDILMRIIPNLHWVHRKSQSEKLLRMASTSKVFSWKLKDIRMPKEVKQKSRWGGKLETITRVTISYENLKWNSFVKRSQSLKINPGRFVKSDIWYFWNPSISSKWSWMANFGETFSDSAFTPWINCQWIIFHSGSDGTTHPQLPHQTYIGHSISDLDGQCLLLANLDRNRNIYQFTF